MRDNAKSIISTILVLMLIAGIFAALPLTVNAAPGDNAKSMTMKPGGNANVLDYIFVFNILDGATGNTAKTTLDPHTGRRTGNNPGGQVSGNNLETTAIFDDNSGIWKIGDKVVSVDIYDLNWNYITTVLYEAFTHQSGNGVITYEGTSGVADDGIVQTNGGQANYWFNGINPPATTRIIVEKKWLDTNGRNIPALSNKYAGVIVITPTNSEQRYNYPGWPSLPANIVVPTRSLGGAPLMHTFTENLLLPLPEGYTDPTFSSVEWNGGDAGYKETNGVVSIDTTKIVEGNTYTLTYINEVTVAPVVGSLDITATVSGTYDEVTLQDILAQDFYNLYKQDFYNLYKQDFYNLYKQDFYNLYKQDFYNLY
ncbi:MAG: hypothetical protein LBH74_09065, partial [Nitrososphaerota archaeon]|nr:hypothetical protein [Nitrososphaerota archaeon]